MRLSKYWLFTLKDIPKDTEAISHQLMLRAGMIRKLTSGIYSWLPTGLRVLRKIENIIRDEMNNYGAIELAMPLIQPENLWQKSERWVHYGPELLRFKDRSLKSFAIAPTHEEVVTDLISKEMISYKQLPVIFYQIQTKFRDEIRPRSGVIRSKEFIMKDAYSFHTSQDSLQKTYNAIYRVYSKIFTRMGLKFKVVQADTGSTGGNTSHEFHALANNGEGRIVVSTESEYTASIDMAKAFIPTTLRKVPQEKIRLVNTSNINSITELVKYFALPLKKTVKTLLVRAKKSAGCTFIALIVRGDHQINKFKAERLRQVATPLTFANEAEIRSVIGANFIFLGPVNMPVPIVIDHSVAVMNDFAAGANIEGKHFFGINWERDLPLPQVADIRKVADGDISPDGKGVLQIKNGIEVGHIFQLGTKYSEVIKAAVRDRNGCNQMLSMGCYGIGITRVVAAAIEQNHDDRGILWPEALAPFKIAILPINMYRSSRVKKVAENIYKYLKELDIDVLFDDRNEYPGVMFSDMELIGIPHQLIIGDLNLNDKKIEYKNRISGERTMINLSLISDFIVNKISSAR